MPRPDCDVSVVIPFTDDEERIGALARRVSDHLRSLGLEYEILTVDEGAGDNSVALLALLGIYMPDLRILGAPPGQGFAAGVRVARGRALLFLDVSRPDVTFAPVSWAHARVHGGGADVVALPGRWVMARRAKTWRVAMKLRGSGDLWARRFVRRALLTGLKVAGPDAATATPRLPFMRFLATFARP